MAKSKNVALDFAFFTFLWNFYTSNRGRIKRNYRALSKKYLDYNDPSNGNSFLRQPQYEALEMYVFLKEYLDNAQVHKIFQDWAERKNKFEGRTKDEIATADQMDFLEELTKAQYEEIFSRMRASARSYPNYIFALAMGTGKTILMATCIFYEFILANKFPRDPKYCHNALVFAPDKTVLQSLREIQTFEKTSVVPPEYVNFLDSNIRYHFLEESGTTLDTLDGSRFNLIISNTQKIILKRQHKEKTPLEKLLGSGKPTYQPGSVYEAYGDLYGFEEPDDEISLATNQRFEKLRRLEQLGIYIDEAHHAFGSKLARDMGIKKSKTSLRLTVDELAASLDKAGTSVVGCFNYTGTPYIGKEVLPEVVYAFGLKESIEKMYLKKVSINSYTNPKSEEFVRFSIDDFLQNVDLEERYEGMKPKMAFFAATIKELQNELRPAVESVLHDNGIPIDKILVNVGDPKITKSEEIREFNRLDTFGSEKQFILLVNKGREGWNCRSLFSVALFRKPKSKIFVLQATMRCLRSISDAQQVGHVYLSEENKEYLDDELQKNFRITIDDVESIGKERIPQKVHVVPPPVSIKLKRVRRLFTVREKDIKSKVCLNLDEVDTEKYLLLHKKREGLDPETELRGAAQVEDLSHLREQYHYSPITLVAEISRYLNKPCLEIEPIVEKTDAGMSGVLKAVNEHNEILYDWIIPRLFNELYEIDDYEKTEEYEVDLIKEPKEGFYRVTAVKDLFVKMSDVGDELAKKSFHLDTYCFDSEPEHRLFWDLLREGKVKKLYFTGMLTHGQSNFFIQYIDPESHTVRSYYPDFLFQKEDDTFVIVEVKRDDKIDDPIVRAKQSYAEQLSGASGMVYKIIKGSQANKGHYHLLFNGDLHSQQLLG